ncbi:MAG TPA: hypothetical protein VG737_02740 [Cyclobacteriaceae bacterium]|nr:hypothetical protein [Cyclobacteriaceae bacterium]
MRRALAIFFLGIILLNTAGYYLVFEGWKWHNSIAWSFDENASNAQEVIIEIPVNVPYVAQVRDWEKADGQFEHNGESYRITKQKLTLDAVYIACVKDNEASRINQQLEDFAQTFSDKPVDGKQNAKAFTGFIKEYVSTVITVKASSPGYCINTSYSSEAQVLVPSYSASVIHPPERA